MKLFSIFSASFLFSLHYATTLYVNSSLLSNFFSDYAVGVLYILGAILNIIFFLKAPKMIHSLGVRRFLILFLALSLLGVLGLALIETATLIAISFVIYSSVTMMVYYALDILLEEISHEEETGGIRGAYLTIANLAILGGPLTVAILSQGDLLSHLYLISGALTLPIFALSAVSLNLSKKNESHIHFKLPFTDLFKNKNLLRISAIRTSLEIFYAVMTIFIPIYLVSTVGFSWSEIGIAFTIMLIPFVVLQWPAGLLADKKLGEKELLIGGLTISILSLMFMPLLGANLTHWALMLFFSRVGASLIELTTESYFFKQVDERDAGMISLFRLTRPTGLILGALLGALVVLALTYQVLFILLIFVFLLALFEASDLIDTR